MTITDTPIDNGVNVQALLDAREALTPAPEAAEFQWRASCTWRHGTHSHSTVEGLRRPRRRAAPPHGLRVRRRPPRVLRLRGQRRHARRVRARRPGRVPHRRRRRRRAAPRDPAALGHRDHRGRHERAGHPRLPTPMSATASSRSRSATTSTPTPPARTSRPSWRSRRSAPPSTTSSPTRPTSPSRSSEPTPDMRHDRPSIIGAGHAGLAMSRRLTERSIDHVVLERGEVANSWRTERWPSLRLLTPNWQTRLPGHGYEGADPDGFMPVADVVDLHHGLRRARRRAGPRRHDRALGAGRRRRLPDRQRRTRSVARRRRGARHRGVQPARRASGGRGPSAVDHHAHPDDLPRSRPATRRRGAGRGSVGDRVPARRRDPPLGSTGHARRSASTSACPAPTGVATSSGGWRRRRARRAPRRGRRHRPGPPRAVATADRHRRPTTLDLNVLRPAGSGSSGASAASSTAIAQFSGSLANVCALADLKMNRLLARIDEWAVDVAARRRGRAAAPLRPDRGRPRSPLQPRPRRAARSAPSSGPPATGPTTPGSTSRSSTATGRIRHDGGVVRDGARAVPARVPFLRRRASTFIHGARADTDELGSHLHAHLDELSSRAGVGSPGAG